MIAKDLPEKSSRPQRRRPMHALRALALAVGICVLLAGLAVGGWFFQHRSQGEATATEWSQVQLGAPYTEARVLALGEATHGNAEFQQLRVQLLQKLPEFRAIVLEEDYSRVTLINDYVHGGTGTAEEAVRQFGFVLSHTEQMVELVQWIRDHNDQVPAAEQIDIVGMDVQRVDVAKKIVLDYLTSQGNKEVAELEKALAGWTDQTRNDETAHTDEVRHALARMAELVATASGPEGARAKNAAQALLDCLTLATVEKMKYAETRGGIMTANVMRIVAEQEARGNNHVLLVAHAGHVDKVSSAFQFDDLGAQLAQKLGEGYRAIGTDYFRNTFTTGVRETRWDVSVVNRTPIRGMFAHTTVGWIDIATASAKNQAVLTSRVPMGSAGEAFLPWQAYVEFLNTVATVPAESFDGLIFVTDAHPVTQLS